MRNPFGFFIELLQQPVWVAAWVFFLMVVNLASLAFWKERVAKIIVVTFMLSAALMMGFYSAFGFEKILGMAHILWVPLLIYVLRRIPPAKHPFRTYLIVFSLSVSVSLAFDVVDVWQYLTNR